VKPPVGQKFPHHLHPGADPEQAQSARQSQTPPAIFPLAVRMPRGHDASAT
jgi:hypothetical protein